MGHCCSKSIPVVNTDESPTVNGVSTACPPPANSQPHYANSAAAPAVSGGATPLHSFAASPFQSPLPAGVAPSPARTPGRKFRWPLPPPSPAKPIMSAILRRRGPARETGGPEPIPEEGGAVAGGGEGERGLDKSFGYPKNFGAKYEIGKEIGRGHFGHTCFAKGKKGELKGHSVAVKIISKAKMTTAIAIEDVRREVKILKALSGHNNLVKFHDAFEDANNVYIVMELCEGGELLDRILARGGRYMEEDAKVIIVQILSVVSYCHLQGVVHRDLKPENFLFVAKDEDTPMKVIDFGLSDFIRPDQRLNDIVGSAYYVAPEVLHRSYSVEADLWSIGVITYILLCGSRPFWARTESGIFRSVLRADPNFDDSPWPIVTPEAKDFVRRLLNKDHRKRMTAAQALTHPWLRDENRAVPLDILIYKLVKSYIRATPFKRAALKALSKALTEDELVYLKAQFRLLDPKNGCVSLENFRAALMRNATDAMKESKVSDILNLMDPLSYKRMDFEEFCAAAISTYQLEALEGWENIASSAFEYFEQEGNRVIAVEELAQELNLGPQAYPLLKDWIRDSDRKLSFLGFTKFLHDQRLNDIVGSAYYVAPEVLHRSYSVEADLWSIGVITYILLCGSRPFWARTESGIFRSVLRADPNFDDSPWPIVTPEAKDFVRRLLNKDHRKRMTAAQALTHPWLRDENRALPLDILIYKLVKSYIRATPFKRAALKALSKALTEDELVYLKAQFRLLDPKNGCVSLENFRAALMRNATDAMKESKVSDILNLMDPLSYKRMDFEEFCAAAISTYQLEALEGWENIASSAFEYFEQEGNRVIAVEELAQELNLGPQAYPLLKDWIRDSDRKLSFLGFTKFLHGVTIRSSNTRH